MISNIKIPMFKKKWRKYSIRARDFLRFIALELFKKSPLFLLKLENTKPLDYFLSGQFHFESEHSHIEKSLLPRIYLTKNEWDSYLKSTKEEIDFTAIHKKRKLNDRITIGFFCSYSDSHFFEKTILPYSKIDSKIDWILCKFTDFPAPKKLYGINLIVFKDVNSAKLFCDLNVDFIIDADGPLRPTKTLELLKCSSSFVLNYYNLITTSNKQFYDALLVPKGVVPAPIVTEKKIIYLDVLGSWNLPPTSFGVINYSKIYHFAIIGEQFKIGTEFLESFCYLSHKYKFIFIGMKFEKFLIIKMKEYGWNLSNIYFECHMPLVKLERLLKNKVFTILDIPNYSSGSGTIIGLSIGIPTICKNGSFWINQMASSIMNKTGNTDYVYQELTQIEYILNKHMLNYIEFEVNIENSARISGYLNPEIFLKELHKKLVDTFF